MNSFEQRLILEHFFFRYSFKALLTDGFKHRRVLYYYLVPALLYCFYNNLSFTNLAIFDPTTYFMLMQSRLLMTGVIYQFLFKKKLSAKQWISLLILTMGCMLQQLNPDKLWNQQTEAEEPSSDSRILSTGILLITIQMTCSVFAGVYNEYIIKNVAGQEVDIMLQNVYMYLDSILCNLLFLGFKGELRSSMTSGALKNILQVFVIAIIINNSFAGIITSLFLKNLNSIVKAFASALELICTALLSFVLLSIPLHWNTILAVLVVSYAVVMYAQNPINNSAADKKSGILPMTKSNLVISPK